MKPEESILHFLEQYPEPVCRHALAARKVLVSLLPEVTEQLDLPAKMIAYCYGQKYSELVCVLIPSKKGLKLGFNKGNELPDPEKILRGTGKITLCRDQIRRRCFLRAVKAIDQRGIGSV